MPTYPYKCECGHESEVICRMVDYDNIKVPEHCGKLMDRVYTVPMIISDYLGEGVKGVLNPVNGQKYDSRSAYEKAVRDSGCVIVGNDAPTKTRKPTNDIDWKAAVRETVTQKNFSNRKGKKK